MNHFRAIAAALCLLSVALAHAQDGGMVGRWSFEGDLKSAAPHAGDLSGEARFLEGHDGQALSLNWQRVSTPSTPGLQLAPGITIDCWVRFDTKPDSYEHIVMKDKEYQLRLDHPSEGGRYAFFVHLGGWEPRIRGPEPKVGHWQHLVARWTGTEISLEVDGEVFKASRTGIPVPTDNPLGFGAIHGAIDELRISNPGVVTRQRIDVVMEQTREDARIRRDHFGGAAGWEGWRADWGGEMNTRDGGISSRLTDTTAMAFCPRLDVDITKRQFLSVDMDCPTARSANLVFITDVGQGTIPFAFWDSQRTTVLDLARSPFWVGQLRFLGISIPDPGEHVLSIENLYLSDEPEGKPFVYVRNLSPERAILRAGRDEKVVAILRGLGRDVEGVTVSLDLPEGVRAPEGNVRTVDSVKYDGTVRVEWPVVAAEPVAGECKVTVAADGMKPFEKSIELEIRPPAGLADADYVPEPVPAKTPYHVLMHYCPLWKFGTHYGWGKIEDWPDRKPALGWYDEGTPEVADWHIKYALEHGIEAFIYCWYRANWGPDVKHTIGHAIHDGLFNAKYLDRFKYCIMWENGCAKGVQSVDDMMDNLLPYWMENYFTHPSYLVIDNKPILFVWRPERVAGEVGGSDNVKVMFDRMRAACRKRGFDGLTIIGCATTAHEGLLGRMGQEGWDYSSAYGLEGVTREPPGHDLEGVVIDDHRDWVLGQEDTLLAKRKVGSVPDIASVMCGWDPRPWHGNQVSGYRANPTAEAFAEALKSAREVADSSPGDGLERHMIVLDNWNEFGEGHYIEPCTGPGFSFVDAIRSVLCTETEPCNDITPEDVGLRRPEHVYLKYKEVMGPQEAPAQRRIEGGVVAHWRFDEADENLAMDSSACGFHAFKHDFEQAEGISGPGFSCKGGAVAVGASPAFWPPGGITVEVWLKASAPEQGDKWIINTVGNSTTGYRLGMSGGHIAWQVPIQAWSHHLSAPAPLPLGEWAHVAATYDNRVMRIYQNGELQAEMERGGKIIPSGTQLTIGNYSPGHPRAFFEGVIDELRIWDSALPAEKIQELAERFGK